MRCARSFMPVMGTLIFSAFAVFAAGCAQDPLSPPASRLGKYSDEGSSYGKYRGNGAGSVNRAGLAGAPGSAEDFKATSGGDIVYFSSDSTDLTPEAKQTLSAQSQWLNRYASNTVTIEGHADERGTREYNIGLGAKRADSVKRYLTAQGVNAARVRTISYGKERPVATCDDISCWSKNRRAQTILNNTALSQR